MAQHAWFFAALGSALLWGYSYAMSEKVFKADLSLPFFMMITGGVYFIATIALVYFTNTYQSGLKSISSDPVILSDAVIVAITYVVGSFLIYFAIAEKNATLANLIEISYPLFTLLFAWVLFKEVQLNLYAGLGGLLIFSGIALIFWKS
ncbi:MAG: EamA family transporter [Pseudomonadota bacterium]